MSASIDAPVASGPPDGPEDGDGWLQRELARRMAERGPGRGGRHARREVAEPPGGVDHVPRHAVATPGPGALRPPPIGGRRRPGGPTATVGTTGWSRPDTDDASPPDVPSPRSEAAPAPAPPPPTALPVRPVAARPAPAPPEVADPAPSAPAPSAPAPSGAARPESAQPGAALADAGPVSTTAPVTPAVVRPVASAPDRVVAPPGEVLGGPSRLGRPAPRAFRRRSVDVRSILDPAPAQFGGPRFHEPDTYEPPEPQEPDSFGGPLFHEPTPPTPRTPDGLVDAVALGVDLPRAARPAAVAADVLPPRDPARLLADPPAPREVETTAQLGAVASAPRPPGRVAHPDDPHPDDPHPDDPHPDDPHPDDPHPDDAEGGDGDADDLDDLDDLAGEDGVLWTRDAPGPTPLVPSAQRTRVIISERRDRARPVRNVETLQDGSVVGELLRTDLIRSQLGLALRYAVAAGLFLGLLPLVLALVPVLGEIELLGIRLPWVLLGFAVYPFLWLLGRLHTRSAERIEREFADQVQD